MKLFQPAYFIWPYLAIMVTELSIDFLPSEHHKIRYFVKPCIMILLMLYYTFNNTHETSKFNLFIVAMFFAWVGDILLIPSHLFLQGLGSFLIMQLIYANLFWKDCSNPTTGMVFQKKWILILIALFFGGLMGLIFDHVGPLLVPVIIYALAISCMVLSAFNRGGQVSKESFIMVFVGAVLFMISDSLIAIDKFGHSFSNSGFFVMITYIIGQYLIVHGRMIELNRRSTPAKSVKKQM